MGHDYDWAAAATLFTCAVIVGIGSFLLKRWDEGRETQTEDEFKGAKADVEKLHLKRSADWFSESHAKNVSTTRVAENFNSIPIGCYNGNTNDPGAWKVAEFQNHLMERHKCCWSVLSGNRPILIRLRASDLLAWLAQRFWVCCQPQFRDLCSGEMHDCFEVSRFDQNGDCNWNLDTMPWVETALTWGEKVTLCIILSCLDERHRYPYEVVLTLETSWNQWFFQCAFLTIYWEVWKSCFTLAKVFSFSG